MIALLARPFLFYPPFAERIGEVFIVLRVFYGRPLSVSGRPCYILPMFFIYLFIYFYGRLILRPWLTEVRENFTRGRP